MTAVRLRSAVAAFLVGLAGVFLGQAGAQTSASPSSINPTGQPKNFVVGKEPALALWFDTHWHFDLTTSKDRKDVFTGSIRADKGKLVGNFDNLDLGKKNKKGKLVAVGDFIFPHKDGGGFDFRFTNQGGVDSLQFTLSPQATTVTIDLQMNGFTAPTKLRIGKDGKFPDKLPITLPARP